MNAGHEALKRQMLIINRLTRAGMPVAADDIIDYLEKNVKIYDYSYPEERGSRMRLLQRDIKS
ncbi:MAG: hypothetical protein K2M10_00560, partial [Muribaculaceae bacterium]|nr:hypothetical protein [Muribaculaceae bacterium]